MNSSRLGRQGISNLHRKLIFRLLCIALAAYLLLTPDPWPVTGTPAVCMQLGGVMLLFTGMFVRMLASLSIGGRKDRVVVKTELYSVCRNPLYFGSFLMAISLGLLSLRWDFTLLTVGAFLAVFYPMMLNEARVLREKFPDFAEYEQRVPLFFPNFRLWHEREKFEFNFPRVKRTLLDASLALIAVPVMILLHCLSRGHP